MGGRDSQGRQQAPEAGPSQRGSQAGGRITLSSNAPWPVRLLCRSHSSLERQVWAHGGAAGGTEGSEVVAEQARARANKALTTPEKCMGRRSGLHCTRQGKLSRPVTGSAVQCSAVRVGNGFTRHAPQHTQAKQRAKQRGERPAASPCHTPGTLGA